VIGVLDEVELKRELLVNRNMRRNNKPINITEKQRENTRSICV